MRTERRGVWPLAIALAAVGLAGAPVEVAAWQRDTEPDAEEVVEAGAQDVVEPGPQDVLEPGPQDVLESGPQDVLEPGPQDVVQPGAQDVVEAGPQDVVEPGAPGSPDGSTPERTGAQAEAAAGPEALPAWFSWFAGRVGGHVNGARQGGVRRLTDRFGFRAYDEDARLESTHVIGGAGMIDVGASLRVWRRLSVGASYAQLATSDRTTVTGLVPHPLTHDAFRDLPVQELSFPHLRRATHVFVAWRFPVAERIEVSVFAGPSLYGASQGVVSNVTVDEAGGPPFETVRVDLVQTGEHARNAVGGHVGMDVQYMPTRHVGVGFFVRYAGATVDLPSAGTGRIFLPVGGAEAGGGLRFRF